MEEVEEESGPSGVSGCLKGLASAGRRVGEAEDPEGGRLMTKEGGGEGQGKVSEEKRAM